MFQLFNVNIATEILKIGFNTDIVDEGMKIFVGDRHPKIIYFLVNRPLISIVECIIG